MKNGIKFYSIKLLKGSALQKNCFYLVIHKDSSNSRFMRVVSRKPELSFINVIKGA